MRLVTVTEMLAIEMAADSGGLTFDQMMENAGKGLAETISYAYSHKEKKHVLGLVGKGNNGGDTLIAMSILAENGWKTSAYVIGERPNEDKLLDRLANAGGEILLEVEDKRHTRLRSLVKRNSLLLDGLLGTGIRLPLKPPSSTVLKVVRNVLKGMDEPLTVVAVDCPSGVDCDSGEVDEGSLYADLTVCMAAVKTGMLRLPAFAYLGELCLVNIGLPDKLKPWKAIKRFVVDEDRVGKVLPPRPLDAHKGTFGTAMIAAGSVNFTGAARLAGEAAYRIGAGLVTLAVPAPLYTPLSGQFPEATWVILPDKGGVIAENAAEVVWENLKSVTALLVGPGFGVEDTTKDFVAGLLSGDSASSGNIGLIDRQTKKNNKLESSLPPTVVDADGLKILAQIVGWPNLLPAMAVLTPHPGEMAILTGESKDSIQENRIENAERYSKEWGHVVVLKGAFTVIASPDGQTAVLPVATPALARAGTGDVLAGMIAGLLAQGLEPFPAAFAGAWVHAHTGLSLAERFGSTISIMAGDLLDEIPSVLGRLK